MYWSATSVTLGSEGYRGLWQISKWFDNDILNPLMEADPKLYIQELLRNNRNKDENEKAYKQEIRVAPQLSETNKNIRRFICTSLLSGLLRDRFLSGIVTGDEKWIFALT